MTQMIYRPKTGETLTADRKTIEKVVFKGIPLDALIVDESQVDEYLQTGWFDHPDKMLKETEQPARRGRKPNDRSNDDSQ